MPLTEDYERAENQTRMDEMALNIDKMRAEMRWEARRFAVSAVLAVAASVGAGIAIGNHFTRTSQQSITVHLDQPLVSAPK